MRKGTISTGAYVELTAACCSFCSVVLISDPHHPARPPGVRYRRRHRHRPALPGQRGADPGDHLGQGQHPHRGFVHLGGLVGGGEGTWSMEPGQETRHLKWWRIYVSFVSLWKCNETETCVLMTFCATWFTCHTVCFT